MLDSGIEKTIVITAIVLWIAHGWYLNTRLDEVHKKLDRILEAFDGLRGYLYETDPQFDDERELAKESEAETISGGFSAMSLMKLEEKKEKEGRRTLNSPF